MGRIHPVLEKGISGCFIARSRQSRHKDKRLQGLFDQIVSGISLKVFRFPGDDDIQCLCRIRHWPAADRDDGIVPPVTVGMKQLPDQFQIGRRRHAVENTKGKPRIPKGIDDDINLSSLSSIFACNDKGFSCIQGIEFEGEVIESTVARIDLHGAGKFIMFR
jgi:hypothetical protein